MKKASMIWLMLLMTVILQPISGFAESSHQEDADAQFVEYLASEKSNLTLSIHQAESQTAPLDVEALKKVESDTNTLLALINAKISSLEGFLTSQKKQLSKQQEALDKLLQAVPGKTGELRNLDKISKLQTHIEVTKKTIDLINENLELSLQYQDLLHHKQREISIWKARYEEEAKIAALDTEIDTLNHHLGALYQHNIDFQQAHPFSSTMDSRLLYEANVLLNHQQINLVQQQIAKRDIQKSILKVDFALFKNQDIKTYQTVSETYKKATAQLGSIKHHLEKMYSLLSRDEIDLSEGELESQFKTLKKEIRQEIDAVISLYETLDTSLSRIQEQLLSLLGARQGMAEYNIESWPKILDHISRIPLQFYTYVKILMLKMYDNYLWLDLFPTLLLWGVVALELVLFYFAHRVLLHLIKDKERERMTLHLYDGLVLVFYKNLKGIALFSIMTSILYFNHVPYPNYRMMVHLFGVWFVFRFIISIAKRMLLLRVSDESGKDVKLYYRILWMSLLGGLTTALMVFSHEYPLSIILQDIFNRLFMLFLLLVSVVMWRSREMISHLLSPLFMSKVRYIRNASKILLFIIPLTVFLTALVGLFGFSNLAWTMARYQAYLVLVLVGFILCKGLLTDVIDLISLWMIRSLENGWLWTEVFLRPIDKILHIGLLIGAMLTIGQIFGFKKDSAIFAILSQIGQFDLINVSGIHITVLSTVEFLITLAILFWAARWSREFSFRWLYRDTKDIGVRNSLSVFTQYSVILLGGFLAFRVLGLDLSGMSMILGGLAVGLGFGLRDFANNIVGGIMLLIERPVREGDLITLGEFEGRVSHIGIRSMRVSTWDNMEVLVPNAETFNKPFTNWTHQDSIVRTVLPIKVRRQDCPKKVQQMITDVLHAIPEVLKEPASQVFLKQIDEALLAFEVRYFTNIQMHGRMEVRSKVLFAISERFQQEGIKAPIPPMRVMIRNEKDEDEFSAIEPPKE